MGQNLAAVLLRLVGVLMMLTALAVGVSYVPDRPVETLVARWAPAPSDFLDVHGQLVHVRDEGPRDDPSPLLLLHGTGSSLHTWQGWVAALKPRHRVISFDLPGAGLTGPFTGQHAADDYRGDTLARFTLELADALKLPRFSIAGNSVGGEVAWRVAALAPARVDRLILVDATGYPTSPTERPVGLLLAANPLTGRLGESLMPRGLVEQTLQSLYGDPSRVTRTQVDRNFELLLRDGNRRALRLRLGQSGPADDLRRLATLKLPTLILWGERDRLIPPATAQRFAHDITGARVVLLTGLGHLPQEEDPKASVAPVQAFLDAPLPRP